MLRNSVDVTELKNRLTYPKNNYFCYRWRIKDHFNRSIDRQRFHLNTMGAGNDVALMNDRIMQLYKASFGTNRKDLIVSLAQDAMNFLDRRRGLQKRAQQCERALADSTLDLVHYAFNVLLAFSAELNSLMGLSELFITPTEPEARKVGGREGVTQVVQSGFSTNLYRLVIDGRLDCINFYIVPADTVLSMQEITLNYNPIERWQSKLYPSGEVYWFSGDILIQDDMVEVICSELLRALIQSTEERLMPPEQYVEGALNLFELSAPAPWEVDMQKMRAHADQNNAAVAGAGMIDESIIEPDMSWQTQTGRGIASLSSLTAASMDALSSEQDQFETPGLAEEIGLMTGCEFPALADWTLEVAPGAYAPEQPSTSNAEPSSYEITGDKLKVKKNAVRKPARKTESEGKSNRRRRK